MRVFSRWTALVLAISLAAEATPTAQVNWIPPDVDSEKIEFDSSAKCDLAQTLQSASERIQELVLNLDRYTATENIEHFDLNRRGAKASRETRKFNYLVEIHQSATTDPNVEEHRSGWIPAEKIRGYPERTEFPGNVVTVGLPMLALIFHPRLQPRYEFACEGLGSWKGTKTWVVHFRQRPDRNNSLLTYQVERHSVPVGLRGRAWIDATTSQVIAMESDILASVPEIHLQRDHQLIEYGPVPFKTKDLELWLPKSADWYCAIKGQRYLRHHIFTGFLLYSVEDREEIGKPSSRNLRDRRGVSPPFAPPHHAMLLLLNRSHSNYLQGKHTLTSSTLSVIILNERPILSEYAIAQPLYSQRFAHSCFPYFSKSNKTNHLHTLWKT